MQRASTILFLLCSIFSFAQKKNIQGDYVAPDLPLDSQYKLYYSPPAKFDSVSEATVTLVHRVWRVIDMNEKENKQLFGTNNLKKHFCSLYDVLFYGIYKYKMFAYKDDNFGPNSKNKKYNPNDLLKILVTKDSVEERYIDENSGEDLTHKILRSDTVNATKIIQYWIKEDWYYNKHNGALEKQIVSLSPVVLDEKKNKCKPLFWVYYPECRELLSSFEAFYPVATGERFTYDQLLQKKSFNSYLMKETNVYERKGTDESTGINLLIESERAKEKYIKNEDKLWDY